VRTVITESGAGVKERNKVQANKNKWTKMTLKRGKLVYCHNTENGILLKNEPC
jgi:hypothetical protein